MSLSGKKNTREVGGKRIASKRVPKYTPYTRCQSQKEEEKEEKKIHPVPVLRGEHAGVLGGGEMASIGVYTRGFLFFKLLHWNNCETKKTKHRGSPS